MMIRHFARLRVSLVAALTVAFVAMGLPAVFRVAAPARATGQPSEDEPGRWRSTGSMNTPRADFVATLLSGPACATASRPDWCGRVLVTGGSDGERPLASAEIYDPATGTWQLTGSMTSLHGHGHLAVLLGTGEVLVAGGFPALDVAEIYDPATGTWRRTMTPPRFGVYASGAALLPGGRKVLVVAGDGDTPGRSQLFDLGDEGRGSWVPTTPPAGWHPTPTITILGRAACTRALLVPSCGKALVVGGASAELYDPQTQVWQPAGVLPMPISARSTDCDERPCHSATLLADGRVLVTGTQQMDQSGDTPQPVSGLGAAVYDPAAGTWKEVAPMSEPREGQPAVELPFGRVLVAGGGNGTAEVYKPADPPVPTSTGPLLAPRSGHVLVALSDGRVLAAGGKDEGVATNSAEIYDPAARVQPPSVIRVDPPSAPAGDERPTVTLTGAGLGGPDVVVEFGGVRADVQATSSTPLTVSAPKHPPGRVPVRVTTAEGSSAITTETMFSYHEPTISSSPGPKLPAARSRHTATTVAGGKVLFVGGEANRVQLATADLYDPSPSQSEQTWAAPGNLAAARAMHTATPLDDGTVLVAGGEGPSASPPGHSLASAELFVPGAAWASVRPMSVARLGHTATVLGGGKVLVVGGTGGPQDVSLASAELYDPGSRTWTLTGSLLAPRSGHTAALLADGRVLVAGGDTGSGATAELYDPVTGTWSPTGSMLEGRSGHTATLTTDGVMVVGGGKSVATEIYRPGTGRWEFAGRLQAARDGHTATVLPAGDVVVAGGTTSGLIEIHPAAGGDWSATVFLATPVRAEHTSSLLLDGRAMLAGGCGSTCTSVEMLTVPLTVPGPSVTAVDPPAGASAASTRVTVWGTGLSGVTGARFGTVEVPLAAPASDRAVVVDAPAQAQGTVPVVLVHSATGEVSGEAAVFTYGPGAWRPAAELGACGSGAGCGGRFLHAAAPLPGGRVLVVGGTTNFYDFARAPRPGRVPRPLRTAQIYDHAAPSWRAAASMATARFAHTATALPDGRVLVVGGQNDQGQAIATAEVYDPGATDPWKEARPLSSPRFSHTATLLPDGRVLVAGGAVTEEQRYVPLATAEIFDPRTDTWVSALPMAERRQNHTATVLDDRRVMVAGGLTGPDADAPVPAPPDVTQPTLGQVGVAVTPSVEIFDTRSSTWTSAEPMSVGRYVHSATLLGGPRCLLSRPPPECGRVLVAGGGGGGSGGLDSAELFDPSTGTWGAAPQMERPAAGHSATLLPDGSVLVAGGGPLFPGDPLPGPLAGAQAYDPASGWRHTSRLDFARAGHTATPLPDGTVLVAGGYSGVVRRDTQTTTDQFLFALPERAEVYTPAPVVLGIAPGSGPVGRRTPVNLRGTGFAGATVVHFGSGREAGVVDFTVTSPSAMVAVSPPRSTRGAVEVTVDNAGGTSAQIERSSGPRFTYLSEVGAVHDLAAEPVSATDIRLTFTPPDDGQGAPTKSYVVVQHVGNLSAAGFDAATRLCEAGECQPAVNGTLLVTDLAPGTRYSYALRAIGFGGALGPVSNIASAVAGVRACPPTTEEASAHLRRVFYPAGRYSLIGLPPGTHVHSDSPLYSWLDQGAGGGYTSRPPGDPVVAGHGYWAYFFCPAGIELSGGGVETVSMPLGPYHASMVGNPSASSSARVTGQDFSARWDPDAGGAGGYRISGYREADALGVGEGSWVFSYSGATVSIGPP